MCAHLKGPTSEVSKLCTRSGVVLLGLALTNMIEGVSLEKKGERLEAVETMRSALPLLARVPTSEATGVQLQLWTERLLTRLCLASIEHPFDGAGGFEPENGQREGLGYSQKLLSHWYQQTLEAFRSWAQFWKSKPGQGLGASWTTGDSFQRRVWREYYTILWRILQNGVSYPPPIEGVSQDGLTLRMQQIAEIKHVETMYESLLLKEIRFPKAQDHNQEVESWVDMVMENWNVVCGSGWQDEDLGKGGKQAYGRNILDVGAPIFLVAFDS